MDNISQSSDIKELFSKLLVTKNKLKLIKSYYSNLSDSLVTDLDKLYNDLLDEISWIGNQLSDIESRQSELATSVNAFTALTSPESEIVGHAKYKEMLDLYNKYIADFYSRMTNLEKTYEESFFKSEMNKLNSSWKFHYSDDRTDASNVVHSFSSMNITNKSDVIEITANRYIFRTEENFIVDADYKTKNCYVVNFDGKTISNRFLGDGSEFAYFGNENAKIIKLFRLYGSSEVYALVDMTITDDDSLSIDGDVVGSSSDGPTHIIHILKYDLETKTFNILLNIDNTSTLYIKDKLLSNYDIVFLKRSYDDFRYFYIGQYLVRIKVEGNTSASVKQTIVIQSAVDICSAIIVGDSYLVLPMSNSSISVFDLSRPIDPQSPFRTRNTDSLPLSQGESGTINCITNTDVGIFFLTDKSIWKTTDLFVNVTKDDRAEKISTFDLSFRDQTSYTFDDNGYFYFLSNNEFVYCIKYGEGFDFSNDVEANKAVVMSPTRYSDRLFFMKNDTINSTAGYAYNRNSYLLDGEDITYSTMYDDKLICLTSTGKVAYCDIKSGLWTRKEEPLVTAKTITSYYDIGSTIYFTTSDSYLMSIDKSSLIDTSTVYPDNIIHMAIGSVYSMVHYDTTLYLGGHQGRVSAFNLETGVLYKYDDETNSECVNSGMAMGNQNIRAMTTVSDSILVVMGNMGKIASCNMVSKLWTSYSGGTVNGSTVDSKIYNDGSAVAGENINCCINYLNQILFVFSDSGRMATMSISNNAWTNSDGINPGALPGPNIHNDGSMVNFSNIRSAAKLNENVVVGSSDGYIASISLRNGGITTYKGLSYDVDKVGPGIYYDGSNFGRNAILSLFVDNINNSINFSGGSAFISTYSIVDNEVLRPDISKLYYIGRNSSDNDYLSSLLVQLSTETLKEYKALYPPRDIEPVYTNLFNNTFYIYKNGNNVYRLSSDFKQLYRSTDGGVSSVLSSIGGTDWINDDIAIVDEPYGYVTEAGDLLLFLEVNKVPHFLFANSSGTGRWYSTSTFNGERDIKYVGHLSNGGKNVFYVNVENANGALVPAILKYSDNQNLLDLEFLPLRSGTETVFETEASDVYIDLNSDGYVVLASSKDLMIHEYLVETDALDFAISSNVSDKIPFENSNGFFTRYFTNRNSTGYLKENGGNFLGFFTTGSHLYNYAFADADTGNVNILNVAKYNDAAKILVDTPDGLNSSAWDIFDNIIQSKQFVYIFGNTRYTTKGYAPVSRFSFVPKYLTKIDSGKDGLLGFDISYYENYSNSDESITGGLRKSHVVISLNSEVYGKFISPNYRTFKVLNNCGHLVTEDRAGRTVLISTYSDRDENGRIRHTNLINKFVLKDTIRNNPLRSLSGASYSTRIRISKDNNAFAIKCKLRTIGTEKEVDAISRQEAIRYKVSISSPITGKSIFYEVEKTPIISRNDRESGVPSPLFKVLAIDRFDARITELYTSKLSGRQTAFYKVQPNSTSYPASYDSQVANTWDFIGFVDYSRALGLNNDDIVDVRIYPVNTLHNNVDAQFFIETYKTSTSNDVDARTEPVKYGYNNINRSEFKDEFALENISLINIGLPGSVGFLERSAPDVISVSGKLHTTNHNDLPQINSIPLNLERGKGDTYCVRFVGNGDGTFYDTFGIITHSNGGTWKFTPYGVNRKRITYSFDEAGSKKIADTYDINVARAGRNLFKMHNYGVFGKGTVNFADFYTAYGKGISRIAKIEGVFNTYYGQFEVISALDGYQRRIKECLENQEGDVFRKVKGAYDSIYDRQFGLSYDIIDRYSIFELPNYYIQAWWIPAKGYVARGNETLLTFDDNDAEIHFRKVGRYRRPFDSVTAPVIELSDPSDTGVGSGIGSGGQAYDPNKVAFSELIEEKYPLEHWEGFNDLDIVRKWKDTFVDRSTRFRWVVEKPKDSSGNSQFHTYYSVPASVTKSSPTVSRNLYYYNDDFDWEHRGTQTRRYMTGYYYDTYDWKIYFHEEYVSVYDYPEKYKSLNSNYTMDKNLSVLQSETCTEAAWYVPETNSHNNSEYLTSVYTDIRNTVKPTYEGIETWPRPSSEVVGEELIQQTTPIPDMVAILDGSCAWTDCGPSGTLTADYGRHVVYRRASADIVLENNTTAGMFYYSAFVPESDGVVVTEYSGCLASAALATKINSFPAGTVLCVSSSDNSTVESTLVTALAAYGITETAHTSTANAIDVSTSGRYSSIYLGVKGKTGQIKLRNGLSQFGYQCDTGLIRPYKFSNGTWTASSFDTEFGCVVKQWFADGNASTKTVSRTPTKTQGTKTYDRYVGGAQWRYLYGTKYTISYSIGGLAKKTLSKTYYRYTAETPTNASTSSIVYYAVPTFWDVRAPLGGTNTGVVDKEFISRKIDSSTLKEILTYKYYKNDGTVTINQTESFDCKYKWMYVADKASFIPIGVGNTPAERRGTSVTCTECYQWTDGSIYNKSAASYKISDLEDSWGITSSYDISNSNDGTNYNKNYTLTLKGLSLTNSSRYDPSTLSRTLYKTENILYASTTTTAGKAGTKASYWSSPTGV